jgi:RimJ/RimL family protein N-acetyltransferase
LAGVISVDGEIGYWLARDRWGRGYATEAGRAVVDWYFGRGARVLTSGYFDGNQRSGGVLAKLGFQAAGDRMKGCLSRGEDVLSHRVLLTRAGWRAGQAGLSFRPVEAGDLKALTALVSDWAVVRNLGSWPWPPEPDFTASRARPYAAEGFVWAIVRDGAMVGTVSVTGPEAELGYMLRPDLQGQGIGGLAARAAVAHAFATRETDRIKADIWADNVASGRLLARMGFVRVVEEMEMSKARSVMTASEKWVLTRDIWECLEDTAKTG